MLLNNGCYMPNLHPSPATYKPPDRQFNIMFIMRIMRRIIPLVESGFRLGWVVWACSNRF